MKLFVNRYSAEELRAMLPYLLLFNGTALVVCIILGLAFGFDWRVYSGLAAGNLLMLANFVLIGVTAEKVARCRDFRRGRSIAGISYALRYTGIFAALAGLLTIKAVSPVSAVIPLVFPKLYYTFFHIKLNSQKEEQNNDS